MLSFIMEHKFVSQFISSSSGRCSLFSSSDAFLKQRSLNVSQFRAILSSIILCSLSLTFILTIDIVTFSLRMPYTVFKFPAARRQHKYIDMYVIKYIHIIENFFCIILGCVDLYTAITAAFTIYTLFYSNTHIQTLLLLRHSRVINIHFLYGRDQLNTDIE